MSHSLKTNEQTNNRKQKQRTTDKVIIPIPAGIVTTQAQ